MESPDLHTAVPPQTSTELTVRGDVGQRLISAAGFREEGKDLRGDRRSPGL